MIVLGVLGMFCLVYYLVCALYAGITASFLWIWPAGGLLCLAGALFLFLRRKNMISMHLPGAVQAVLWIFIAVVLVVFVVTETRIISGMTAGGEKNLDYVIVLGAQVKKDGPSRALQHRIDKAAKYLKENPNTMAILSGGKGDDEPAAEAKSMAQGLKKLGIDQKRLILEEKSTNTDENFRYSLALIKDEKKSIGVITSNFHVFRGVGIAKRQTTRKIVGIAAPSHDIMQLHYLVREFFAVLKDTLTGHMKW